jgi:myxalamid-type polyketide synthase MxaE and MxaD
MERRMIALPAYRFHRDASLPGQINLAEASSPRIDHWFYQMSWREQALKAEDTPRPVRDATTKTAWLLFANDSGLAEELTRLIREDGGDATIVRHGERFERLDFSSFVADAEDHEQVAAVLDSLHPAAAESLKVLFLHALDLQARNVTAESTIDLVCQIAGISKALAARAATSARLWLVTRGAQQISAADQAGYPPQTSLWGLSAVAALEQTPQWGGIVDLGSAECKVDARFLLEECTRGDGDQRVASRGGKRHVARIMPGVAPASTPVEFSADSVYMITGAFGSIGMELAQWLVDRGARHLLLLGRSDVPELQSARSASQERAVQAIHRWREAGVRIDVAAVDVADRASMERKLSELRLEGHSLRGIFHAAAELVWMPLVEQTRVDVARSFHAKVRGAIVLDELTRDLPLEFFVFFSSAAVSMGAMGAGSYAAANAFVDALVEERRSQGRNFISVQWGYWARKDAKNRTAEEQFQRSGFVPMQPLGALDALARVMGSRTARAIVADVDLERLKAALALRGVASFLDGSQVEPKPNRMKEETALTKNLQTLEADARLREMKSWICSEIRRLCGWPSKRFIDEDRGFFDMGMTSLTSLELRRSLEVSFGSKLPGTATLLYPNVNSLAAFVHGEVFGRTINAGAMSMQPALDPDLQLNAEETRSALVAELELLRGGAYHG